MGQALLVVEVMILGLILLSLWVFVYQLIKQQGRILLRIDHVEQLLTLATNGRPVPLEGRARQNPLGLAEGTAIPSFELPDLTGRKVGIEEFRGKQVLLVHWSPQCGFCDLIAPDLAKLQVDLQKQNVQMLFISHGSAENNQVLALDYGLECPILLLGDGSQTVEAFQSYGTPAAYLLDEEGKIAAPLAVGADQVPVLAREAAAAKPKGIKFRGNRSLAESRIERGGLKTGTPAPVFSLTDVRGQTVSLEEYRGRRVLLIFTDPHCGPCDQLAPHLVRVHHQHRNNNLSLIMVGRGDVEENRRKADVHGFEFPVVLQRKWELSKAYGIFETPVAFQINEDGVIERNVAKGVAEILALLPHVSVAKT